MTEEATTPPTPAPPPPGVLPARKLGILAALLAALLIPHLLIDNLIAEREARQEEVQRDIANSWGAPQSLTGPVLVVPYQGRLPSKPGQNTVEFDRGALVLSPTTLRADVALSPESRQRGLFGTTVYTATTAMEGHFILPEITVPEMPEAEILWDKAYVLVGSDDLRGARAATPLEWDGAKLTPADIAIDSRLCAPGAALRWPVRLGGGAATNGRRIPFSLRLDLRGTSSFRLYPMAAEANVRIAAPWPSPSFIGNALPDRSEVNDDGFSAHWSLSSRVPLLRRNLGVCSQAEWERLDAAEVALLEAVPTYRMISRASKYAMLFLALSFTTYALFELMAKVRIHVVQYALLGCSVVLFPLLLLALGEPLGFATAYLLSTLAVATQASTYTAAISRRGTIGGIFCGILIGLFGFLYVVLSLESYSLLAGTLAVFLALSCVMMATRRVEWSRH